MQFNFKEKMENWPEKKDIKVKEKKLTINSEGAIFQLHAFDYWNNSEVVI